MKFRSIVLSLILGAGCANAATVTEKSPVTQDLSAYRTATVGVTVAPGIDNPDAFKSMLGQFVESNLKEKKLADVVAEGGDLTVKITITKLDKPTSFAGIPAGELDATVTVELIDAKASKPLGAFDITANSKKGMSTSVNGTNTATGEDPRKRALQATADQIGAFLERHRGAAAAK